MKRLLAAPVLVDLRNIYEPAKMTRQRFTYISLGRGREDGARIGCRQGSDRRK